jgi:hypothetical protein
LLARLQAVIAGYHALQFLHMLPFSLGPMTFFGLDFLVETPTPGHQYPGSTQRTLAIMPPGR